MINNNKILTVSYGTFSCTLEGFDDSFDTMKAIAEYFRDLAADDRYFGAEPPQPDADMLARIAEREVSRRVEAHEHEGRILLKAHETAAPAATAAATQAVAQEAPAPVAEAQPLVEEAEEEKTVETAEAPITEPEANADIAADSGVAAEAEIEADKAEEPAAIPAATTVALEDIQDLAADTLAADTADVAEMPLSALEPDDAPVDNLDTIAETPEQDEAIFEDAIGEAIKEEIEENAIVDESTWEDVIADAPVPEAASDDIAAVEETLAEETLIDDAVVEDAKNEETIVSDALSADALDEDETLKEVAPPYEDGPLFDMSQQMPASETPEMENEAQVDAHFHDMDAPAENVEDTASAFFAQSEPLNIPEDLEEDVNAGTAAIPVLDVEILEEPAETAASAAGVGSIADKLERIRAVVSRQNAIEDTESLAEDDEIFAVSKESDFEDDLDLAEEERAKAVDSIESAFYNEEPTAKEPGEPEEDENDELSDILSRIEAEGADTDVGEQPQFVAEGPASTADDADREEDDNLFSKALGQSAFPDEAGDELTDLLETPDDNDAEKVSARLMKVDRADLEAAIEKGALEEFGDADDPAENAVSKKAQRDALPEIDQDEDGNFSRLMDETEQQMAEPEGATRRSAFAHLRAAVAARFADRSMSRDLKEQADENTQAFKSDLAEVVKPSRPGLSQEVAEQEHRPAPLKLVAEQRVNTSGGDATPVAPRRVAALSEDTPATESNAGFREYAEELGAHDLPDLLEAAAAYLAFVEGVEEFSRPQLMSRVRQADGATFSREDGLRSFGKLLRTGKIEKIRGGRFTAADKIGFKPDARQAG